LLRFHWEWPVTWALLAAMPASASTIVGGITFNDNAFADTLISSSGSYTTSGGSLSSVLTDIDASTYAFSNSPGAYVQLGFTDNTLVNGTGADLAIFELGVPDSFVVSLTLGGTTHTYASSSTGFLAGVFQLNDALINLDDFGVGTGASLSSVVVGLDTINPGSLTVPSLSLVGAMNSTSPVVATPEPAALYLMAFGLAGICFLAAKQQDRIRS
jgi:hypothetical protein